MIVFHHDTSNGSIPFKGLFGLESFFHVRRLLEIDEAQRRVVVDKNGCIMVSFFGEKATHLSNQTWGSRLELVNRNTIAWCRNGSDFD